MDQVIVSMNHAQMKATERDTAANQSSERTMDIRGAEFSIVHRRFDVLCCF